MSYSWPHFELKMNVTFLGSESLHKFIDTQDHNCDWAWAGASNWVSLSLNRSIPSKCMLVLLCCICSFSINVFCCCFFWFPNPFLLYPQPSLSPAPTSTLDPQIGPVHDPSTPFPTPTTPTTFSTGMKTVCVATSLRYCLLSLKQFFNCKAIRKYFGNVNV